MVSAPARAMMLPEVADDPWTQYCLAYVYAGHLLSSCGRNVAAQMASEKFGVRIAQSTARRASISAGPPSRRGAPLIIPQEIEVKVEEPCLCLRELKLPVFRFMVLNYINVLVANTDIAERLRHKEVRRHWYYNWLGRCKRLKTATVTPLELTRAQWATAANSRTKYDLLAFSSRPSWQCKTRRTTRRGPTGSA